MVLPQPNRTSALHNNSSKNDGSLAVKKKEPDTLTTTSTLTELHPAKRGRPIRLGKVNTYNYFYSLRMYNHYFLVSPISKMIVFIEFTVRKFGKTVYSRPNPFGRRRKKNHNIYGNSYC